MNYQLVEARCPKCSNTAQVKVWDDGATQEAYCFPNHYHRTRKTMRSSGLVQMTARLAVSQQRGR